jgi:ribose/xylose/arabinose/galactoside ABC-type transport system permease subunit
MSRMASREESSSAEESAQPSAASSHASPGGRWSPRLSLANYSTEGRLLLAAAALALVFVALFPEQFASLRNAENIARHGAILLVVAVGQMFALLVGGFDISVGANMGFASTVGALVMVQYGTIEGVLAGLGAATAVGLVNGVLIARFRISPFVATLGMLTFVYGLANHISDGRSVFGLPQSFGMFGRETWGVVPSTVGIASVVLVLAWFLLTRTRVGLYVYAIGGSRDSALLAGVPVPRYEILAYACCGLLAGVAGLMLSSRVVVGQASLGQGYELLSIATAVIGGVAIGGGIGRLLGVVLGVALLSIITTGMNIAGLSEFIQMMLTGAVLITAVLVDRLRGRKWFGHLRGPLGWRNAVRKPEAARRTDATERQQVSAEVVADPGAPGSDDKKEPE